MTLSHGLMPKVYGNSVARSSPLPAVEHDNWDEFDRVMAEERRAAVLIDVVDSR